ncbi:hypothetical protein [Pseudomonas sp. R2-37-08W]|uniref:hypothetical protein n=1 Tax=Pseudomonas sp. R2-37-08W TaxID=1173273 RepID=UPI000F57A01B|nr:hypothetical protein [Pseudomonas sp. R2-37-08W]
MQCHPALGYVEDAPWMMKRENYAVRLSRAVRTENHGALPQVNCILSEVHREENTGIKAEITA